MPTPDNPDEFYLLLALVTTMVPFQWYLARELQQRASRGTSFFQCFFLISGSDLHTVNESESDEFKATLKTYKRRYIYVMLPVFAVIFGVYLWHKAS